MRTPTKTPAAGHEGALGLARFEADRRRESARAGERLAVELGRFRMLMAKYPSSKPGSTSRPVSTPARPKGGVS